MLIKKLFLILPLFFAPLAAEEKQSTIYLSEKVAAGNDWLINKGEKSTLLKPLTSITSRAISITLFPVCTTIDMAVLTAKQAQVIPHVLLSKDSDLHKAKFKKNAAVLKKNALGLLTAPMGILSPDIVTHHFVPSNIQTYQLVPYGKLYSVNAHVTYPESIMDIQSIIKEAERANKSVSVVGKAMSQGKQAISNDAWNVVINTSKLNQITIYPELKVAKVGSGASWGELQREANQHGLAVRVMQASNIFSIGGSISANCHGWDYKTGCLRNTILALTIVDSKGEVLNITPDDPQFDYIVGGYGAFGVIAEAIISLTDNLEMVEHGIEINPRDYVSYFNQNIRHNDDVDMHLYRLSLDPKRLFKTGIAVNYQRLSDEPVVAALIDEPEKGTRLDRIKLHTLRRFSWLRNLAWNIEKNDAMSANIASRNELMRPPINPVFNNSKIDTEWLQEYFVKEEDLADFLDFLGGILQQNNVALFNASVRFVKQDTKSKLSYAQNGDRFAIVLFFNQKLSSKEVKKTKIWVQQVVDYLIAHEGSYYLPYQHFATLEQFKACYPNWESIISYKQATDPHNRFNNGLHDDYLNPAACQNSLFRKVFARVGGQREQVRQFLNNVFMQLDEKKFFQLVDSILENPKLNDEQIYEALYNKIGDAKPNALSGLSHTLQSLKCLKYDLSRQTASLVNPKQVKGYVEIGYPGRMTRSLEQRIEMEGPYYVINDQEALSDYVEGGIPRPYDKFVALNDYEPISEQDIPTASVDLVCMYIGLHHAPQNKLDPFIDSIQRILKPGGLFILMDHDANTQEMQDFVDVVHSIFNVGTGVNPETNNREIRDFHALNYWIERLESRGLIHNKAEPLVRKGDSTLNSLIRFEKPLDSPITMAESSRLDVDNTRLQMQTYLTGPEWQNVRAAQRYAAFLEHEPAYRYPYFREIVGFWKVYGRSWLAAQKQNSFSEVAFSEYNLMNLFVGTSMTLEYGVKGLIAAPAALVDKVVKLDKNPSKIPSDQERLRSLKDYGAYIESTPFYKYPYFRDIGSYWSTYLKKNKSLGSRVKGMLVGAGMTAEYTLKGIVSTPMSYFYGSEGMKEPETTHIVVQDQNNIIETIDPNIRVVQVYPEHQIKHVEIPRYMYFTKTMLKIAQEPGIRCVNISGNDKIQVDVKISKDSAACTETRLLYEIPAPTDLDCKHLALEVDVSELCEVLRALQMNDADVLFIHDY